MKRPSVVNADARAALVLTCEHASCAVPAEYNDLGLRRNELEDHIGWDIGAAHVTDQLAARFAAPAILSQVSRLLIDCNRDLREPDLIVGVSDGIAVPGNVQLTEDERQRRIRDFYDPYHHAIDAVVKTRPPTLLLSVHSFTASMNGQDRPFDVGVLFDVHTAEATRLGNDLQCAGFRVRYNEPYSGLDGLIYSAKTHGTRHGVRYLELEINNALLRTEVDARAIADRIVPAVAALIA